MEPVIGVETVTETEIETSGGYGGEGVIEAEDATKPVRHQNIG